MFWPNTTKRSMYFFSRAFIEPSRVYSRTKESYRLPSRTATVPGVALCFDFVYYWCQPFFLLAPRTLVRFPFSLDSPSAPTPYGQAVRSLQRAVFTNFISFLWGIKSSRSRPRRKERGLEREQRCGKGEASRSKSPLSVSYHPPPVDTLVTWLGGADRTPSFSLVGVRYEERGKPTT